MSPPRSNAGAKLTTRRRSYNVGGSSASAPAAATVVKALAQLGSSISRATRRDQGQVLFTSRPLFTGGMQPYVEPRIVRKHAEVLAVEVDHENLAVYESPELEKPMGEPKHCFLSEWVEEVKHGSR